MLFFGLFFSILCSRDDERLIVEFRSCCSSCGDRLRSVSPPLLFTFTASFILLSWPSATEHIDAAAFAAILSSRKAVTSWWYCAVTRVADSIFFRVSFLLCFCTPGTGWISTTTTTAAIVVYFSFCSWRHAICTYKQTYSPPRLPPVRSLVFPSD